MRSNSLISGNTSEDKKIGIPGNAARKRRPNNASCSSFRKEKRSEIAIASTLDALSLTTSSAISSSANGITTSPLAPILSVTSRRLRRCTNVEGGS